MESGEWTYVMCCSLERGRLGSQFSGVPGAWQVFKEWVSA
jgi:hypothetical protein